MDGLPIDPSENVVEPEPLLAQQNEDFSTLETEEIASVEQRKESINIPRAVAVLTNITTGTGLLGIPFCFCSGIGTNYMIMIFIGSLSMFSFSNLIDCSTTTGIQDYPKLTAASFAGKNVTWFPNTILFLTLVGATILYLQFSLSLMISVFQEITKIPAWLCNRWFGTFGIQLLILLPLSLLKTVNALSFVSLASVVLIAVFSFHTVFYFVKYYFDVGFDPNKKIKYFDFDLKLILPALSIQCSSYTCHPNIFPTLSKLRNPTKGRQNLTMFLVVISATVLYTVVGIFAYLTLFDRIKDPVVLNYYNQGQMFTIVIKACYSLLLVLTIPHQLYACRFSVNGLFFKSDFTTLRWILVGIVMLVIECIVSVTVKKVSVMFSFVGGVTCPLLVYVLPSIYYIRICKGSSTVKTVLSWLSLIIGVAFIGVCLYDAIRSLIKN